MKKYVLICLMLIMSNAFCALSPFYQSTKEIESILTSPKLAKKLSSYDKIQNIIKSKDGYLIITQNNFLKVDLVPIPSKMVGPVKYKIIFYESVSLKDK